MKIEIDDGEHSVSMEVGHGHMMTQNLFSTRRRAEHHFTGVDKLSRGVQKVNRVASAVFACLHFAMRFETVLSCQTEETDPGSEC